MELCIKEVKNMEELNIAINPNKLRFITKFKTGNVWTDTYILKCDYEISKMKFQEKVNIILDMNNKMYKN